MPRLTDFVKGVSQCVLAVRFESNIEVDGGTVGWVTQADPVVRDGIPLVLYKHILPRRREGRLGTNEERNGKDREQKDGENGEPVVEHVFSGQLALVINTNSKKERETRRALRTGLLRAPSSLSSRYSFYVSTEHQSHRYN